MTAPRPLEAPPKLGAQLRATAHEPDDGAAEELRARLRHKMFGRGRRPDTRGPEVPAEPRVDSPSSLVPWLGWIVPAVAILTLAGMTLWLNRARSRPAAAVVPSQPAALPTPTREATQAAVPPRADPGPALLEAANQQDDPAARSLAIAVAVAAAWAEPSAAQRLDAAQMLASDLRKSGEPRRALGVLRSVLDDLELQPDAAPARARLLQSLAEVYDELGRAPAAAAVRAEADRLTPADGAR